MKNKIRFIYEKYRKNSFMTLDEIGNLINKAKKTDSWSQLIKLGILVLILLALYIIRAILLDEEIAREKQEYSQRFEDRLEEDVQDDMDGKKET